jgi:Tol biopolymer transport system component
MGTGPERQPSLSNDGTRLAYSTYELDNNLVVQDLKTGKESEFGGERRDLCPALAPDGSAVAYVSEQVKSPPDLWIQPLTVDGSSGGPARRLTDHPGSAAYPSYSPDGRWIAYHRALSGERDIWIVPAAGGAPIRFTDDPAVDVMPAWSPDGLQIAFVSERAGGSHIWVAPVADGKPGGPARQVTSGSLSHTFPAWSLDASTIAYIARDASGRAEAWLIDARGAGPAKQLTHGAGATAVGWSRTSGKVLVSGLWAGSSLRLMEVDITTGKPAPVGPPQMFGRQAELGEFAVSRNGRLFVYGRESARGDVWIMEAARGKY